MYLRIGYKKIINDLLLLSQHINIVASCDVTVPRVCKVFDTKFATAFSKAFYIALRWSARRVSVFSIDILLRWSKETSLEIKTSSRQRRDMSIEVNIIGSCTPAECYVLTRDRSGKTLL